MVVLLVVLLNRMDLRRSVEYTPLIAVQRVTSFHLLTITLKAELEATLAIVNQLQDNEQGETSEAAHLANVKRNLAEIQKRLDRMLSAVRTQSALELQVEANTAAIRAVEADVQLLSSLIIKLTDPNANYT